jgi:hypothetical protein
MAELPKDDTFGLLGHLFLRAVGVSKGYGGGGQWKTHLFPTMKSAKEHGTDIYEISS